MTPLMVSTTVNGVNCSVPRCRTEAVTRGWCGKHYQRWRVHGDPTVLLLARGVEWGGRCSCGSRGPFPKESHECLACRKARHAVWRTKNAKRWREIATASLRRRAARIRELVFDAYGRKCACCGEKEQAFLCIDHVNGGGNAHRREIGRGGLYPWLVKNKFPKGFQTLCHNCNFAKAHGGCPHKRRT